MWDQTARHVWSWKARCAQNRRLRCTCNWITTCVWTTGGTITSTSLNSLYTNGRHIGHGHQPCRLNCLYFFSTTGILAYFFILCSSQTRLQPLPVQTQGTQLLMVFIQLYYNNSHQQYENEVSHSSMFKISML